MRGNHLDTRARRLIAALLLTAMTGAGAEAASLPLSWNAPTTNADGTPLTDLAEYRIYLATSTPACPGASFHSLTSPGSAPAAGQTVSTHITALTAGTTYFARVTAVDSSGNESGCSAAASGPAQADFTVAPTGTTSFGSVAVGGTVDRIFTVRNTSAGSFPVSLSVGAPFTIVSGASFSLAAGASRNVTVRFRPTSVGSFAGNVNVATGGDTLSRAVSGLSTTAATATLTVTKSGTGAGTVSSAPEGIACGGDCTESGPAGTQYTLSATPAPGSTFAGWSGACSGTGTCVTTVDAATTVTARFTAVPQPVALSVSRNGAGSGTVSSNPAGIACGLDCTESLAAGTQVTLTASADAGSVFAGWGGACSGSAATCSWTMSAAAAVTATFDTSPVSQPVGTSVPVVTALSPARRPVKSAAFTLAVTGSGFTRTSVVRVDGTSRATTFVSATQLRARIPRAVLLTAGTLPVSVVTPAPGGGTSGTVGFTVDARRPKAGSLSPARMAAGSAAFTLAFRGAWFAPGSVVRWNGADRPTTVVSDRELHAAISAADLAAARKVAVSVFTPTPGGGTSVARTFTVTPASTAAASTAAPSASPASTSASSTSAAATSLSAPGNPTVTRRTGDAAGATFDVAWSAAAGATSYRYVAGFNDGSAGQQGTVTGLLAFQLRMPYHASGTAGGGFVCLRSIDPAGQLSASHSCAAVPVPAR